MMAGTLGGRQSGILRRETMTAAESLIPLENLLVGLLLYSLCTVSILGKRREVDHLKNALHKVKTSLRAVDLRHS